MAIDFPSSPTVGQQYTYNGITYTYTAQGVWSGGGPGGPTGATGSAGTGGATGPTGMTGAGTPATVAPLMDGAAAVGTTVKFAREDHVHPTDTSRVADTGDTMTGQLQITNTTASTSPTTGALTVAGGIGIGGNAHIAGNIYGRDLWANRGDGSGVISLGDGSHYFYMGSDGVVQLDTSSKFLINSTIASTSSTTGALTVAGGVGVGGSINSTKTSSNFSRFNSGDGNPAIILQDNGIDKSQWTLYAGNTYFDYQGILNLRTSFGGTTVLLVGIDGSVVLGAATGGAKGTGTINATAVYDDNVLLTCVGVQYLVHGEVDLAQWDKLSPKGKHTTAHRFVELVKTFDPRDPRQYIKRMLADEALPGMPTMNDWQHGETSLGELHNRLWLATELLASAFVGLHNDYETRLDKLTKRVEALEKGTT